MDSNCFYYILLYIFIILKGKWVVTFAQDENSFRHVYIVYLN